MGDAIVAVQQNVPLLSHDHSGTGSRPTNKLLQANTHQSADTDSATTSIHHTIGTSATQAAAGNHTHVYVPPVIPSVSARILNYVGYPAIATNTDTTISYTGTDWNTDPAGSMWNSGTPNIVTIKTAGIWRLILESNWGSNSSGIRVGKVLLNGTTNANVVLSYNINAASFVETNISVSKEIRLNVNDVLRVDYFQNSGSNLSPVNNIGGTASFMGNALIATWIQP